MQDVIEKLKEEYRESEDKFDLDVKRVRRRIMQNLTQKANDNQ